jgi:hypothetical protein
MPAEHDLFGGAPPGDFVISLGEGKKVYWHEGGRAWTLHGHRPDGEPIVDVQLGDGRAREFEGGTEETQ